MTWETHCVDILIARYMCPSKDPIGYAGLAVYSLAFKSGQFFRVQSDFWSYCRKYESDNGLFLFEIARGPSGCFDPLINSSHKDFENGLHSALEWSNHEPPEVWAPPVETQRLVCDRGTFVTLEILGTLVPGFNPPTAAPAAPAPAAPMDSTGP